MSCEIHASHNLFILPEGTWVAGSSMVCGSTLGLRGYRRGATVLVSRTLIIAISGYKARDPLLRMAIIPPPQSPHLITTYTPLSLFSRDRACFLPLYIMHWFNP